MSFLREAFRYIEANREIARQKRQQKSNKINLFNKLSKKKQRKKISLLLDVSGSMKAEDTQKIFKYFKSILNTYYVHVIEIDHKIRREYDLKDINESNFMVQGNGGTILFPGLERCKELNFDITIVITDGYCENLNGLHKEYIPKNLNWIILNGYSENIYKTGRVFKSEDINDEVFERIFSS